MPSDTLLASALLGTARRPLAPAERARAAELHPAAGSPPRQALVLAAADSLTARATLETTASVAEAISEPPPDAPAFGSFGPLLMSYLSASLTAFGKFDTRYFATRGLAVPSQHILPLLESAWSARGSTDYLVLLALGERGYWLARHHPTYQRRTSFLDRPSPPSVVGQRIAYAVHHLSTGQWPGNSLAASPDGELLHRAARAGALAPALGWADAAAVALGDRTLHVYERDALERLLALESWPSRANQLGADRLAVDQIAKTSVPAFAKTAAAAIGLGDSDLADALLRHAVSSSDVLLNLHTTLPALVRTLGSGAFAAFTDYAVSHFDRGWRDKQLLGLFAASAHDYSLERSEDLIVGVVRRRDHARLFPYHAHAHRLHPMSLDRAAKLTHEFPRDPTLQGLTAMLTARQVLDRAFPSRTPL